MCLFIKLYAVDTVNSQLSGFVLSLFSAYTLCFWLGYFIKMSDFTSVGVGNDIKSLTKCGLKLSHRERKNTREQERICSQKNASMILNKSKIRNSIQNS